jgi:hypothetical protein
VVSVATMLLIGLDPEDRILARMAWRKIRGDGNGGSNERYA